jgi:hypothetical protein
MKTELAVKVIVVLASIAYPAWAQEDCSLSTLSGDYLMTGRAIGFEGYDARVIVGVLMADGKGGLSTRETQSRNGVITRSAFNGAYTLEADCTGIMTSGDSHWDFVLTKDGAEGVFIRTNDGTQVTRTIKKR